MFSADAGVDVDPSLPLSDASASLVELQKSQKAPVSFLQLGVDTNVSILESGDAAGVRSYIVAPPMVCEYLLCSRFQSLKHV